MSCQSSDPTHNILNFLAGKCKKIMHSLHFLLPLLGELLRQTPYWGVAPWTQTGDFHSADTLARPPFCSPNQRHSPNWRIYPPQDVAAVLVLLRLRAYNIVMTVLLAAQRQQPGGGDGAATGGVASAHLVSAADRGPSRHAP